jgi:RNA polymerase sigma-70 factor (ECF subfamily)
MASAFEKIADRHRDRVFTYAAYCLGDRDDAEDVTQEVLVRLWRHWESLDDAHMVPWLIHVTRNLCIDTLRRRRTQRGMVAEDPEGLAMERAASPMPGPAALAETADFQAHVQDALRDLPEPYRSIVILREIQDLKYEEIGAALGMPLNTVKVYLHRGRRKLRDRLRERVGNATQ